MNAQERQDEFNRHLTRLNAGLYSLRRLMGASVPSDFDWSFCFGSSEVFANWIWTGDEFARYQPELRARDVAELLAKWGKISWARERSRAKLAALESLASFLS